MPIPPFITALRAKVGSDLLWLTGVTAVVTDDEGRILLGQRADSGRWALISGILEPGEEPAVAIAREVKEETGVDAVVDALVALHVQEPMTYPNGDQAQYLDVVLVLDDVDDTVAKMGLLKTKGVRFSVDDFGTGYSSLAYLKRLPITTIKIDQTFIADLGHDPEGAAITKTVVAMAHGLGLNVVAEGVENEVQAAFLAQHRCDEIQGFWVARPLDAVACLAFIRNREQERRPAGITSP